MCACSHSNELLRIKHTHTHTHVCTCSPTHYCLQNVLSKLAWHRQTLYDDAWNVPQPHPICIWIARNSCKKRLRFLANSHVPSDTVDLAAKFNNVLNLLKIYTLWISSRTNMIWIMNLTFQLEVGHINNPGAPKLCAGAKAVLSTRHTI